MTKEERVKMIMDTIYLQRDLFKFDLFTESEKELLMKNLGEINELMSKNEDRRYTYTQSKNENFIQ